MLRPLAGSLFLLFCQCAAAQETAHVKCWGHEHWLPHDRDDMRDDPWDSCKASGRHNK